MCTLIVLDRIVPGCPLVVASNRDEFYARPAAPPTRIDPPGQERDPAAAPEPPFVAPQDLEAGGTWMGINAEGLFVGLTNRRAAAGVAEQEGERRSRGLLVRDALAKRGAAEVARQLKEEDQACYQPFHLLAADGRESCLVIQDGAERRVEPLSPGRYVVCNRDPDDPSSGKVRALTRAVEALPLDRGLPTLFAGLAGILSGHGDPANPLEHACVHTEAYGTRSSSLLATSPVRWRFWHAEGPPCEAKYRNLTRLLDELR